MAGDLNIGGVSYPKEMVASKKVTKDGTNALYTVTLKSGIKLEYPKQKGCDVRGVTHPRLFSTCNHLIVNGMTNGKITGSKDDDSISLSFCKNLEVDVSNDPRDFWGGDNVRIVNYNDKEKLNIKVKVNSSDDKVEYSIFHGKKNFERITPFFDEWTRTYEM